MNLCSIHAVQSNYQIMILKISKKGQNRTDFFVQMLDLLRCLNAAII